MSEIVRHSHEQHPMVLDTMEAGISHEEDIAENRVPHETQQRRPKMNQVGVPESEVEQMEQGARIREEVKEFNYSLEVVRVEIQPNQLVPEELKTCPICYNYMEPRSEGARLWSAEIKLAQCGHSFCE